MNKRDIVDRVAGEAGIARTAAEAAVGAVFASMAEALARGEDVAVTGFGRFARKDRPARVQDLADRRAHRHRPLVRGVVQGRQVTEGRAEPIANEWQRHDGGREAG